MDVVSNNHLDGDYGLTNKVKQALKDAADQFIYIGFLLKEADDFRYYLEGGFENIYDYCEENFGFGRSSTNNFIRVYRQFGSKNGIGLMENYQAYSYSQLTEMCSMNMKQLNECNPYMTVRELREVKKGKKVINVDFVEEPEPVACSKIDSVQTSGQFALWHLQALEQYFLSRFSKFNEFFSPSDLCSFVKNTGCSFSIPVYALGMVNVDLMCLPEHIEVKVNKDKAFIPYFVGYYIYSCLLKYRVFSKCHLKPDVEIHDMGKCDNCGNLCSFDDSYCSQCGFKIC